MPKSDDIVSCPPLPGISLGDPRKIDELQNINQLDAQQYFS